MGRVLAVLVLGICLSFACTDADGSSDQRPQDQGPDATSDSISSVSVSESPSPDLTPAPVATVAWKRLFADGGLSADATLQPVPSFPVVSLEPAFDGLVFSRATGMYQSSTGEWFITEQAGRVFRVDREGIASLWLDVSDRVADDGNERGLRGFALSPDFEETGLFYLGYTNLESSVLSRFQADGSTVDPGTERVLLSVHQPSTIHGVGQLQFGPDGYLYVGFGDAGALEDLLNLSQNLETVYGSILRLDVSRQSQAYSLPEDNPFVNSATARGEVWAYGFRNPWRFSFDAETGDLWAGDVGQHSREEINVIHKGGNYGWRIMEGSQCADNVAVCHPELFVGPVLDYPHGPRACAVIGGFVYRGEAIPDLQGAYIFSDLCSGVVSALRMSNGVLSSVSDIAFTGALVSSFAQDRNGELYVVEFAAEGQVLKLVP